MSPQGSNLSCQACHESQNHHMLGRGLDLLDNDSPEPLECNRCHSGNLHASSTINRHMEHVACQTCHIPTSPRTLPPKWPAIGSRPSGAPRSSAVAAGNRVKIRGLDLTPTYAWFDMTSQNYTLFQPADLKTGTRIEFAQPNGNVAAANARIFPMKEHTSASARYAPTGEIIPHSTYMYLATGDIDKAVREGMRIAGIPGATYDWVDLHTYQTLTTAWPPRPRRCNGTACRAPAPARMDLKGELGYSLKGAAAQVCTQCHGPETISYRSPACTTST